MKTGTFIGLFGLLVAIAIFFGNNFQKQNQEAAYKPQSLPEEKLTQGKRVSDLMSLTDPAISWEVQVARIERLQASALSQQDLDALYALLKYQPKDFQRNEWYAIANEIMGFLRHPQLDSQRLTKVLQDLAASSETSLVLRDYAVQHLAQAINPQFFSDPSEINPTLISDVETLFSRLIVDPTLTHTSVPGTALTVLSYLHRTRQKISPTGETSVPISPKAEKWLSRAVKGEEAIPIPLRTSALYAAGVFQLSDLHPVIRELAASDDVDPSVRLTSISALGSFARPEDRALLSQLAASKNNHRFAARAALEKIPAQ